ncbi:hypothetical protein C2845_PM05G11810 [Panicum miliaceum]|uniref:Uncharacterized protein n=1 Tax=Panicum miliaceum TaxID=4540 RepID=A0A3L6SUT8_PANMI|nr:hypothetical protein C2845_PM05G11810 [Panicum miliaceum]
MLGVTRATVAGARRRRCQVSPNSYSSSSSHSGLRGSCRLRGGLLGAARLRRLQVLLRGLPAGARPGLFLPKSTKRMKGGGEGATGDSHALRARAQGEVVELPLDALRRGLQPGAPLLQQQQWQNKSVPVTSTRASARGRGAAGGRAAGSSVTVVGTVPRSP